MIRVDAGRIKKPILTPLAITLALLLAASLGVLFWIQHLHIRERVAAQISSVDQLFAGLLWEEAKLMRGLITFNQENGALQAAFRARDREALLNLARPLFKEMRAGYQVTHFYFIDPERRYFLRVHEPDRSGDIARRHTLDLAAREGGTHFGLELNPYGILTLSVVRPWLVNGRLIGYIELGKEIEHIIPRLRQILGVELIFLVETRYLDRVKWEQGLRMMGRTGDWDAFPGHVVIGRTMPEIPAGLGSYLALSHEQKKEKLLRLTMGEVYYRGGFVPLMDAAGREIGEIVILKDYTTTEKSWQILSGGLATICIVLGAVLLVFFNGTINRVERRLAYSRRSLEREVAERRRAEERIKASLKEKELLLREIHHRVKNNLQVVSSLFRLQLRRIDDPRALEILRDSQSRISAMALVHQTLYQPGNLTSICLREYIKELALNLFESYGADPDRISLSTELADVAMEIDTVIPCGLVINELVTNALKYAFPAGRHGKISIILKELSDDAGYLLTVGDNGVGLPEDLDIRRTASLGLQLVVNLIERQLQGTVEISRQGGTTFTIRFRQAEYQERLGRKDGWCPSGPDENGTG